MNSVEFMAGYLFRLFFICTFVPNIGSQADATKGKDLILFVEEVGESMHNIDRQMRILPARLTSQSQIHLPPYE